MDSLTYLTGTARPVASSFQLLLLLLLLLLLFHLVIQKHKIVAENWLASIVQYTKWEIVTVPDNPHPLEEYVT